MTNSFLTHYCLYNLHVVSELSLHALSRLSPEQEASPVDVAIRRGPVPPFRTSPTRDIGWTRTNASETLIRIRTLGKLYIHDGVEIIADLQPGANLGQLHSFLIGLSMANILQQRGILPLHGSCLCRNDQTLLIVGESGAGKSTLSTWFLAHGWQLMCDDIVPISFENGTYYVSSGLPLQNMCQDAVDREGIPAERLLTQAGEKDGQMKYIVDASAYHVCTKLPVTAGVYLTTGTEQLELSEVTGFPKVDLLMRNRFIRNSVPDDKVAASQLQTCLGLAKQMQLFLAERPLDQMTVEQIARYVLGQIES